MAKRQIVQGATSEILEVFIQSAAGLATTGIGLTGLTSASAGLTCYYHINTAAAPVAVSLVTMTVGTFTTSGFKEVDSANMPGVYQLCLPNTAYASGKTVTALLKGATDMVPLFFEIEITQTNNQDGVRGGMTALPAAVPGAAGGVFIAGSNAATTVNITGNITGNLTGNVGGNLLGTLTTTERDAISDALLNRNMATGTDSGSPTVRTPRQALRALRNKVAITGSTIVVNKEDDTTPSWSGTVTFDASAVPVTAVDPV